MGTYLLIQGTICYEKYKLTPEGTQELLLSFFYMVGMMAIWNDIIMSQKIRTKGVRDKLCWR